MAVLDHGTPHASGPDGRGAPRGYPGPMARLLLVEDDARATELVRTFLEREGYVVHAVGTGPEGLTALEGGGFDLVVLDWMLPGMDGVTVCARARAFFSGPILMLTARTDEVDQVVGLEVGADDYLAKPVRPRVLLARVRALLRRAAPQASDDHRRVCGWVVIDSASRAVTVAGVPIEVTTADFDLLWLLAEHAGTPVDRDTLFQTLRGISYNGLDRSMDMRVSQLRKRLIDADPEHRDPIRTVRAVGYQLVKT